MPMQTECDKFEKNKDNNGSGSEILIASTGNNTEQYLVGVR